VLNKGKQVYRTDTIDVHSRSNVKKENNQDKGKKKEKNESG